MSTSAARPAWSDGDDLESRTLPPVTRLQLIKYAGASGDYNPIHTIDEAAEEAGLPGVIAHGMLTAATISLLFSPYLEHGYVRELKIRFLGMVHVGDEITISAYISGREDSSEGSIYNFEVQASKEETTVASGAVDFLIYKD
ncbi:MAG: dehydratase [Actinomycetota bacterium]|nr:dehydratase [Actinomycetota bacterium]